jgi:dGTPase
MIAPEQLVDVEFWRRVTEELGLNPRLNFSDMERHRMIRRLVGKEVTDVINATAEQLAQHQITGVAEVRQLPYNLVRHTAEVARLDSQLKEFLFKNLYQHWRVMRMDRKARRFIGEMFEAYVTSPIILPDNVRLQIDERGLHRTVCDYIAGMTDRFALQEYSKLFNPMARV